MTNLLTCSFTGRKLLAQYDAGFLRQCSLDVNKDEASADTLRAAYVARQEFKAYLQAMHQQEATRAELFLAHEKAYALTEQYFLALNTYAEDQQETDAEDQGGDAVGEFDIDTIRFSQTACDLFVQNDPEALFQFMAVFEAWKKDPDLAREAQSARAKVAALEGEMMKREPHSKAELDRLEYQSVQLVESYCFHLEQCVIAKSGGQPRKVPFLPMPSRQPVRGNHSSDQPSLNGRTYRAPAETEHGITDPMRGEGLLLVPSLPRTERIYIPASEMGAKISTLDAGWSRELQANAWLVHQSMYSILTWAANFLKHEFSDGLEHALPSSGGSSPTDQDYAFPEEREIKLSFNTPAPDAPLPAEDEDRLRFWLWYHDTAELEWHKAYILTKCLSRRLGFEIPDLFVDPTLTGRTPGAVARRGLVLIRPPYSAVGSRQADS
ncbi:hypothetical protein AURDEDRAFT_131795 [Auricularia subglabra TFB-10046 SS5]|uniref:Uncharacterized protein n=1 Tax=Auricularia subglabra (strain TFB-10046 / SS5) TaxID=717982 RepID=J0WLM6_AURST|nr:hypothetical protein AURDEDRAFT_131795 [Auricularia subglabra TFB-10046 SS5]